MEHLGIFDLIWPSFGAPTWGFWPKNILKSQTPHICPGSPTPTPTPPPLPFRLNIDRCIYWERLPYKAYMLYKIFNFNSYEILLSQWDLTHSYSHQEDRRLFECYQHITFVSWFHYLSSKTILKSRGPFQAQKCREVFSPENALAKSQTSWLQSCFMYSYILNTNRDSRSS